MVLGIRSYSQYNQYNQFESGTKASSLVAGRDEIIVDEPKISEIRFKSKPGELYNLINRDLKLRNESETQMIKFSILCNNPLHYRVHPSTGDIPPGKTIEIIIQINGMEEVSEIGRSFFAKFASDKFQITWYYYNQETKQYNDSISNIRRPDFSKVLAVRVHYDEDKTSDLQTVKKEPAEIETQVQETLAANRKELDKLRTLIEQEERKHVNDGWVSGKALGWLGLLAFLGGAMISF